MWNQTSVNLGNIKARVKVQVVFINPDIIVDLAPLGGAPKIRVSCGCSVAQWDQSTGTLTVTYTPTSVPIHLKQMHTFKYTATKQIFVTHDNGVQDTLTITATITD